MKRRLTAALLVGVLLLAMLPAAAAAEPMTTSAAGIALIKAFEGFSPTAFRDNGQWTIGYGTACEENQYPDGVTEEEAEVLLAQSIATFEAPLNTFLLQNDVTVTQDQFDALASFTYNLGASWMNQNYQVTRLVKAGLGTGDPLAIMNAFGDWSHVGVDLNAGLLDRRRQEVQLMLYGAAAGKQFYYVIYDTCGGKVDEDVMFYYPGSATGTLQTPTREGYTFNGWYTAASGGVQVTGFNVTGDSHVYAQWTAVTPVVQQTFADVTTTDWFFDAVEYAAANGLFSGTSATAFSPNQEMTRGMLVTVLYRMAGSPAVTAANPFTDVAAGTWYTDAVIWAAQSGIVGGMGNGLFAPENDVTREQVAKILYGYAALYGSGGTVTAADLTAFPDYAAVSDWAVKPLQWAVAKSLIGGSNGSLLPAGTATRCQVAAILMRFCES